MSGQLPTHRAVAAAAVVLLHLLLLWIFVRGIVIPSETHSFFHDEPITLWLPTAKTPAPPAPRPKMRPEQEKAPLAAVPEPKAKGISAPVPKATPPVGDYRGLRALGSYLNNCSGMNYEALSNHDLAHCIANQWDMPQDSTAQLRLAPQPPSPWKAQMDKRKTPPHHFTKDCDSISRNSNLGLPCNDIAQPVN